MVPSEPSGQKKYKTRYLITFSLNIYANQVLVMSIINSAIY